MPTASAGRGRTKRFEVKKTSRLEGTPVDLMTEQQVLNELKHAVLSYPSIRAWATAYQIQSKNVYQVFAGKRSIPDNIASVLGYKKVKAFKRIKAK